MVNQSYCPLALSYNAPEVNESENWSVKSDVYSFGVVLLELLTGREPYDRFVNYLPDFLLLKYHIHYMTIIVKVFTSLICSANDLEQRDILQDGLLTNFMTLMRWWRWSTQLLKEGFQSGHFPESQISSVVAYK